MLDFGSGRSVNRLCVVLISVVVVLVAVPARGAKLKTLPCVVEADSTLASPRFAPFRLFDNETSDPESRWASARSAEPHWVVLKFPEPVLVDRVVVHGHAETDLALSAAAVGVRESGTWREIAAVADNEGTPVAFKFDRVKAEAVRLWITDACRRDSTARLFEIELFRTGEKIPLAVSRPVSEPPPRIDDEVLLDAVRGLPHSLFLAVERDDRHGGLLATYRRAIARWGDVLAERIEQVPGRADEAFYGRGGHREDDVRPIAYAVMVNGLLWRMERGDVSRTISSAASPAQSGAAALPEVAETSSRADLRRTARRREDAIAALRYLTSSHVTGPSTCLNGKKWGDAWQSAMWTRAAGVGAWALWEELGRELQLAAARMIEHEADRFLDQTPKSSVHRDTGAEENAWNALIVSLAANMMPEHPRADRWEQAAKRYLYNVLSVPADAEDTSLGDDGRAINKWVTTVNAHSDFTVENHGLVHIGYQKTSIAQLLENAVHYLMADREAPKACRHHVAEATELLYRCAGWDGAPVYFGGNDWKLVHTQPTDLPIYAVLSILDKDRRAALQEERGLERVTSLQAAEDGFFGVRRDLEYGGLCASRLAACYLAHAANGPGPAPLTPEEFDRRMSGVWRLEGGRAILHRTPNKFASFAFGPKWMGLTVPSGSDRSVWPHYASCLGLIDGEAPTQEQADWIRLSPPDCENGFWVVGRLKRCRGNAQHDFAFISPAADVTIYVERLHYADGFGPRSRETGIVGHEYEISSNHRTVCGRFGSLKIEAGGGETEKHDLETDWFQVGDRIGYVVKRIPATENVVRYHDFSRGTGRVPKLQEWFSLIGDKGKPRIPGCEQWACVVAYPNRSARETERLAEGVELEADENRATVLTPREAGANRQIFCVDFVKGRVCTE